MMRKPFSYAALNAEKLADQQNKIELVSCPNKDMICKEHLAVVNKCYMISEQYRKDKNFNLSIEELKSAFYKTTELNELPCSKCAALFRSTITESLEDIHTELKKMSSGIFGSKRHQSSLLLSESVLKEFESIKLCNTIQMNSPAEHYIGNYLKKKVS
jgi:hypothetical protein